MNKEEKKVSELVRESQTDATKQNSFVWDGNRFVPNDSVEVPGFGTVRPLPDGTFVQDDRPRVDRNITQRYFCK